MYEEYTDKQIVEMLVPKLRKVVPELTWDEYLKRPDAFSIWNRLISVIYKSAYIRGQLGRSFIIGEKKVEPKPIERWVLATEVELKKGDKVKMIKRDDNFPDWFPKNGTIGIVVSVHDSTPLIQWPAGTTDRDDRWWSDLSRLEVLVCE